MDQALALAGRPDAAVDVAAPYVGAAAGAGDQFAHVVDGLGRVLLDSHHLSATALRATREVLRKVRLVRMVSRSVFSTIFSFTFWWMALPGWP